MTKTRIAAVVAAATLGAGAFTGATIALAADDTTPSPSPSAPTLPGTEGAHEGRHGGPGGHGDRGFGGPGGHGDRGFGGPGGHGDRGFGGPHAGIGGGLLHSEGVLEDADGAFVTVRMQHGEVTAVSATSLSVKSADGYTSTYTLTDETVVERDGEDAAAKVGDTVHVRASVDGGTAKADHVHALSPERAEELKEHRAAMQEWMSERPEGFGDPAGA